LRLAGGDEESCRGDRCAASAQGAQAFPGPQKRRKSGSRKKEAVWLVFKQDSKKRISRKTFMSKSRGRNSNGNLKVSWGRGGCAEGGKSGGGSSQEAIINPFHWRRKESAQKGSGRKVFCFFSGGERSRRETTYQYADMGKTGIM